MYWGDKETLVKSVQTEEVHKCPVCNTEASFEYRLYQKSFTIFGLSFFPTSKLIKSVCGNCGVAKKVKRSKSSSAIMDSGEVDELLNTPYYKFRYFTGLIVLIALAGLVYMKFFAK